MGTFIKFIPKENMRLFQSKFDEINKILKKNNMEQLSYRKLDSIPEKVVVRYHTKGTHFNEDFIEEKIVEFMKLEITGTIEFKHNGKDYRYIGRLYEKGDAWKCEIVDKSRTEDFKWREFKCDHCGTVRNRKAYFFFDLDGKTVHIGKQCAREYFGINSFQLLSLYEDTFVLLGDIDDEDFIYSNSSNAENAVSFSQFYDSVKFMTLDFKDWGGGSGTQKIYDVLMHTVYNPSNDNEEALEIQKKILDKTSKGETEHDLNMHSMFSLDYVMESNYKQMAYLLYDFVNKLRREKFENKLNVCRLSPGDSICERMNVFYTGRCETRYGYNPIVKAVITLISEKDNVPYVLFTTAKAFYALKQNDKVTVSGIIGDKSYNSYLHMDATIIKKPKIAQ